MEKNFIKDGKVSKVLLALVIPSVIAGVINQLNIVLDTYYLGNYAQYPTESQAATTAATSLLLVMTAFAIMLALGSAIYATQKLGAGDIKEAQRSTANAFLSGWVLYVVFLIVLVPLLPIIMSLLTKNAPTDSVLYLNSYFYGLALLLGYPTIIFVTMPVQLIRAEGKSTIIVVTGIIQIGINMLLDYLLIAEGSPISFHGTNYEALGAGIGTVVSQLFQASVLMFILFKSGMSQYNIRLKNIRISMDWIKVVFQNGVPQFTANILLAVGIFILGVSLAMSGLSSEEFALGTASYGIVVRLVLMMFLLLNGAIQGVQGFFAYQYGSGLKDRIDEGLKICIRSSMIFGVVSAVIVFFFSAQIAGIFTTSSEVIDLVSGGLKIYAITLLFFPFAHLCFGLFASLGFPKLSFYATLIRDGIIFFILALILPHFFGSFGAVITMPITHLLGSFVIIWLYIKNKDKLGVKSV